MNRPLKRYEARRLREAAGLDRLNSFRKIIGTKFSNWTVIDVHRPGGTNYLADCQCVCGTRRTVRLNALRQGRTKSCGCNAHPHVKKYPFLGEMVTATQIASWAGIHPVSARVLLRTHTAEAIVEARNPQEFVKLKLTKTKKRGRPIKTLDGREISHEELLRGLVTHTAIAEATLTQPRKKGRAA